MFAVKIMVFSEVLFASGMQSGWLVYFINKNLNASNVIDIKLPTLISSEKTSCSCVYSIG